MSQILLYRMKPERMKPNKFTEIARHLDTKGELVETGEALAIHDSERALAYAQPGGRFAGLLFYIDQSRGVAQVVDKLIDSKSAEHWATDFLDRFGLAPRKVEDKRVKLSFEIYTYEDQSITFDRKERRRIKLKTEIGSKIELNGIRVVGPRAKVRMVFKDQERPISIHRGLWESIEVYEERELVREHDIYTVLKEKLAKRRDSRAYYDVIDCKIAYFAREFCSEPDILAPFYFIEVEYEAANAEKMGITQGPRQVFLLPAYR